MPAAQDRYSHSTRHFKEPPPHISYTIQHGPSRRQELYYYWWRWVSYISPAVLTAFLFVFMLNISLFLINQHPIKLHITIHGPLYTGS
jgi:hypothetical protein